MARTAVVDTGFLVALLRRRDNHHEWAVSGASELRLPWHTCEAVLSEAFHILGSWGAAELARLVEREAVLTSFNFAADRRTVLTLMRKYLEVPMSLADACLVRMTEILAEPIVLTTDRHFR